ncbi:MAG: branched-chain amino acid ABC transporter ATP-binding protein [Candidatus Altiarchaeales archaeon]|nr:MAG: branched-chain amino acid ABC transporter ATP-binding protein [Candidatus Altiarchaeales archaeon]
MLNVNNINVLYDKIQVLWNLSFKINSGEISTILGSNGAGKTTTVKTIVGLLHPVSGEIRFLGERINKLPPYKIVRRGITLVPEGMSIFPKMSVKENLILGAYAKDYRKTLDWIYQIFPKLREREKQQAGTLSGGEQKMLSIGKALMSNPKLLILDEPSLGLAPKMVLKIFDTIKNLRDDGVTILLVEQNVHHALEISDRGYVIEKGRIILEGRSEEILNDKYVRKSYLGM